LFNAASTSFSLLSMVRSKLSDLEFFSFLNIEKNNQSSFKKFKIVNKYFSKKKIIKKNVFKFFFKNSKFPRFFKKGVLPLLNSF